MTKRQQELIVGKMLGDGTLEDRGNANSRLQIRHSIKQKEYVDWCFLQLREFTSCYPRQLKNSYFFRTKGLPVFTKQRELWYQGKRKILPKKLAVSPFILTVWYMDDGYYDTRRESVWLCTRCYSLLEINRLRDILLRMGIASGVVKDRSHFKIRVLSKDRDKFIRQVKPYIIPSLLYKIGIAP